MFYKQSLKLAILDAIERGCVKKDDLLEYMQSDAFAESVSRYQKLSAEMFNDFEEEYHGNT